MATSDTQPVTVVPPGNLVPVSGHLARLAPIPPSRMFLINKRLTVFRERFPERETFDPGRAMIPGPATWQPRVYNRLRKHGQRPCNSREELCSEPSRLPPKPFG